MVYRSMPDRIANNLATIMIARVAMILTPFILAWMGWSVQQVWSNMDGRISAVDNRVAAVEEITAKQASQIQDHEARLQFAAAQEAQFRELVERRFNEVTGPLRDMTMQINTINGSIIRLQTTIENRLPPRRATLEGEPVDAEPKP